MLWNSWSNTPIGWFLILICPNGVILSEKSCICCTPWCDQHQKCRIFYWVTNFADGFRAQNRLEQEYRFSGNRGCNLSLPAVATQCISRSNPEPNWYWIMNLPICILLSDIWIILKTKEGRPLVAVHHEGHDYSLVKQWPFTFLMKFNGVRFSKRGTQL